MSLTYVWRKPFLKFTYNFYLGGRLMGKMSENNFKRTARAEWNNSGFQFKTYGFFNQKTIVTTSGSNQELATITYNTLKITSTISTKEKTYIWKNLNWNHSKWQITNEQGVLATYYGSSFNGNVDSDTEDPLLIVSGLFIASYFWQQLVGIFMVLFIIFFVANA